MSLVLASVLTLLLLFTFVALTVFPVALVLGTAFGWSGYLVIGVVLAVTVLFNVIAWLVTPRISDLIYRYFYRLRWISPDELRKRSPEAATFLEATCAEHGFDVPKVGIIPDRNPTAFTYGSGRWNSRVVVTEGMFEYLDADELTAVLGHELGHVKHRDFIVMTIASTLLQLLYELYASLRENTGRPFDFTVAREETRLDFPADPEPTGDRKRSSRVNPVLLVAVLAYVLYRIGFYLVLYLSRTREYYADEFAAEETDPDELSMALLKVAYGVLVSPDDVRGIQSTRLIGLTDLSFARNVGLAYYNSRRAGTLDPVMRSFLFDLKSPWASVEEIRSTHPLTGKRVRRLSQLSDDPVFDFDSIASLPLDRRRLYRNFLRDVGVLGTLDFVVVAPIAIFLLGATAGAWVPVPVSWRSPSLFLGSWVTALGTTVILRTLYAFPDGDPKPTTVLDLMSDAYASPIRGRPVQLEGEIVGRGVPGLVVAEDLLIEDETGLMYLDYEGLLPVVGNLFFGLRRVPEMIGRDAAIDGWFRRGRAPSVGLRRLGIDGEEIRGFVKTGGLIAGGLLVVGGVVVAVFV